MNRIGKVLALIMITALTSACVQTRPLISHAHVGHALTTWHDTPKQEGLYTVASKELDTAIEATDNALASGSDSDRLHRHLGDALHALNPDLERFGRGLDYGAIRALVGAIEHLEYAANSEDASDNFVSTVVSLVDQGDLIVERMVEAQELLTEANEQPSSDPPVARIYQLLMAAKYGDPGGGPVGGAMARSDRGLVHLSAELDAMLARETDPDYAPVPKRYVLGLVRLPNGLWGFRLAQPSFSGYGYRY